MLLSLLGDGGRGGLRAGGGAEVAGQRDKQAAGDAQGPRPVGGRRQRGRVRQAGRHAAAHAGGHHVPHHRDAEQRADLTGHRDDRGGDPRLRGRHAGDPGVGDGRVDQAEAGAKHGERHGEPPVGRARAEAEQQRQPSRDAQAAGDQRQAGAATGEELAGDWCGGGHHQRGRQQRQPGRQRRVAARLLQVHGEDEQEAAEHDEREHRDHAGAGERAGTEEPQLDQRLRRPALDDDERGDGQRRDGEQREHRHRGPAGDRPLDDRVGKRAERRDHQQLARDVHPARPRRPRLGHVADRGGDHGGADRHVKPEDGAPADGGDQDAADDRAGGRRDAEDARPDADGVGPLRRVVEGVTDDRQRDGGQHRPADALQHAQADEGPGVRRERAQQRSETEPSEADEEDPLPAEPVGGGPGEQQQRGHDEQVGVGDPLQAGQAGVQVALQRGQRDVEDRRVQVDDEQARRADQQHAQATAAARLPLGDDHVRGERRHDLAGSLLSMPVSYPRDPRSRLGRAAGTARRRHSTS